MLVVSCTVEDCDEMKNQLRKVYAIVAWGNYSHTSKQEVFFRSFGGCIISLGERDLAKKQS